MRSVTISPELSGKKIERALSEIFPKLSSGALYKALRKKDIKANGARIKEGYIVKSGDILDVYISDEFLYGINKPKQYMFDVVYEDENLIVVNKYPGIPVQPDKENNNDTLISQIQDYLKAPAYLCHRLDRNTGGLLISAKNHESENVLMELIKNREITKFYRCAVYGRMPQNEATLVHYLEKNESQSRVYIQAKRTPQSIEIITKYRVFKYDSNKNISHLEVELITGRTHQIRAHLAYIGHPIIGDGKYGTNEINRLFGITKQQLWACKLVFSFRDGKHLNYLKDKTFEVEPQFSDKL